MPGSTPTDTIADRGASGSGRVGMRRDEKKIIVVRWAKCKDVKSMPGGGMTEDKDKARHEGCSE